MKKNLKKVISAVLSLTLALSSFVALGVTSSAATFTDVADTASYSEAVEALAALGAISGYEDGTFQPNNNITRAEVTTMVVAALNMTADAQNSGSTTQFADVNANAAWAAGYVNVGVAQNFISGMSATEFAPSENVTYAQVLTMLTRILGYGDFAEARGGYPNGYLTAASTAGILTGVAAGANDAMTRAQVAQLIWNAVQAPMLDITTFSTSTTGMEMQKMDGKNDRDFRTVLSDKFNAYVLNITVDKTSKSDSALDAGTIEMTLTNSNDYDPDTEQLVSKNSVSENYKKDVAVGNTAAESYLFSSAKVIAEFDDDSDWTLLYFATTSKVAQKAVDGTLVADYSTDADKSGVSADYIRIKKTKTSSTTTNYKLDNAVLYVNGVENCKITDSTAENVQKILDASKGDTILVESQEKSGYYTKVLVDFYAIARVTTVTAKTTSTKVALSSVRYAPFDNPKSNIEIEQDDLDSGDVTVSVTKAGVASELSSLVRDDIVAVKYDVTKGFDDSNFFEIIATTDTITGKYSGYDEEDDVYTINGTDYEAVTDLSLDNGTTYTFYLDPFGKLFDYEEEATTKNFAIVERYVNVNNSESPNYVSSSSSEYSYINVMTLDGQSKTLYIDNNYESSAREVLEDMGIKTSVSATAKAVDIADRIVEYTVKNSNGRINKIASADVVPFNDAEYKESSNRLSKNLTSTAVILDATDYDSQDAKTSDYKASSLSALTNNVKYDGVLVYKNSNSEYCYAVITKAGNTYGESSDFVVAAANGSAASQSTVNDEDVYSLYVMQPDGSDKPTQLYISKSVNVYYDGNKVSGEPIEFVTKGSIFYYTTDSDNFVDEINVVMKGTGVGDGAWYDLLKVTDMTSVVKLPGGSKADMYEPDDWMVTLDEKAIPGDTAIQLALAVVYKSNSSSVSLAPVEVDGDGDYFVNISKYQSFSVASDANIYAVDMSGDQTGREAYSTGSFNGSINSKDIDSRGADEKGWLTDKYVDAGYSDLRDSVQLAYVMVVDGTITNALVFDR